MVQYLDNNSGFNQWNANRQATTKRSAFSGFLWWTLLFFAAWWLMGAWMSPRQNVVAETATDAVVDLSAVPVSTIKSENIAANVQGLRINNIALSDFAISADDSAPVTLLADTGFIEVGFVSTGTTAPLATTVWDANDNVFSWRNSDGVKFTRTINTDGYLISIVDTVHNATRNPISVAPYARIVRENNGTGASGVSNGAIAYVNSDVETVDWRKLDKKSYAFSTTTGFAGFADQYWETVASIDALDQTIRVKKSGDNYIADAAAAAVSVAPGADVTITTNVFAGPRDQSVLDAASSTIVGLDETIDYGWFWFLARPMLWLLNVIHTFVMNYGVAIIIMTILLRLAMWPLTRKSYVATAAMQKMQPEMQRIQKLYANDKARMQMEMLRLYQTHRTSPMSGCLPMLIQIPIFFALYKALLVSVNMRNANFLWIHDLAAMDPYFILPILMGATMWLQQYLQSPKSSGAGANDVAVQTQRMMRWMPILFTVMFAWMPAGLVLYWTVSNIFGIIQMFLIKRNSK